MEGRASEREQLELLQMLRDKEKRDFFNSLKLDWKNSREQHPCSAEIESSWSKVQAVLLKKSYEGWQGARKLYRFSRVAAIFFFVVSMGGLFWMLHDEPSIERTVLTNTVIAENGQISKVELPDGSRVWLNSGSTLTYNNFFASDNREITLRGEAYFEVEKNADLPLVVNSGELNVKVLGTKFNVSAYPGSDRIDVVLESGKVELTSPVNSTFSYKLEPGELATFNKTDKKLNVGCVNTSRYTSWKEGIINIYNQPLPELVAKLESKYNQKFELTEGVKNFHYTFTIQNESLEDIIRLMEKITPVKAEQKGDVILIKLDKNRQQ